MLSTIGKILQNPHAKRLATGSAVALGSAVMASAGNLKKWGIKQNCQVASNTKQILNTTQQILSKAQLGYNQNGNFTPNPLTDTAIVDLIRSLNKDNPAQIHPNFQEFFNEHGQLKPNAFSSPQNISNLGNATQELQSEAAAIHHVNNQRSFAALPMAGMIGAGIASAVGAMHYFPKVFPEWNQLAISRASQWIKQPVVKHLPTIGAGLAAAAIVMSGAHYLFSNKQAQINIQKQKEAFAQQQAAAQQQSAMMPPAGEGNAQQAGSDEEMTAQLQKLFEQKSSGSSDSEQPKE